MLAETQNRSRPLMVVMTGGDKRCSLSELCAQQTNRGDTVWADILQGSHEVKQQRVCEQEPA